MSLLSPSELAAIQTVAQSGMATTCSILTRTTIETDDGQESVWATTATDVPCWVYEVTSISATLGAIAGAVGVSEIFSIRLPIGTEVSGADQIGLSGRAYTVQHTNVDSTYPAWLVCACRLID